MAQKTAAAAPSSSAEFEEFLERAGAKERLKIEKHLAAVDETDPDRGRLWRRLAMSLAALTPLPIQSSGKNAWQFFVPDGKYKKQVFALEDPGDGLLMVYLPDVLKDAMRRKIIGRAPEPDEYSVPDSDARLRIEALDSENTPEPPLHYKHMLGWNRKSLRVTLSPGDDTTQLVAASAMFQLAAREWAESAGKK